MSAARQHHVWSELAVRENDGIAVSLLWSSDSGRVKVAVVDVHLDEEFEFNVPGGEALAAFHHPYAYATGLGASFGDAGSHSKPGLTPERSTI